MSDEYLEIQIGSSSYKNAGIVGLIYLLQNSGAEEEKDYIIERYYLKVNKEYLNNMNLSDAYTKAFITKNKSNSEIQAILNGIEKLKALDKESKDFGETYTKLKNRIKERFNGDGRYNKPLIFLESDMSTSKKVQELRRTIKKIITSKVYDETEFDNLKNLCLDNRISEFLSFADVKLSISIFWNNKSFMYPKNYIKEDHQVSFKNCFEEPLIKYINKEFNTGKKRCVECDNFTKDYKLDIGFIDSVRDSKRKKSYFWDQIEDSAICPVCALLYTLMPLGFIKAGQDYLFVNSNSSIQDLVEANRKIDSLGEDNETLKLYLFKRITLLTARTHTIYNSIQIDTRTTYNGKEYKSKQIIIDSNLVKLFSICKTQFERLYSKSIKTSSGSWYSVYDNVIDHLLNKNSLYGMIDYLYNEMLRAERKPTYLLDILTIEINRRNLNKGVYMKDTNKLVNIRDKAYYHGKKMRESLIKSKGIIRDTADLDNALRSRIYTLSDAVRSNDGMAFVDILINMYTSLGEQIPKLLLESIVDSDKDAFGVYGRAFIIGLKSFDKPEEE